MFRATGRTEAVPAGPCRSMSPQQHSSPQIHLELAWAGRHSRGRSASIKWRGTPGTIARARAPFGTSLGPSLPNRRVQLSKWTAIVVGEALTRTVSDGDLARLESSWGTLCDERLSAARIGERSGSMSSVQPVDECVIRWWRGYVKSCFFAVVDPSSPADGILTSPLFWSLRKSYPVPDGPIAAAHQQLVEKLLHLGWQPADVGAFWYEQRFLLYEERSAPEVRVPVEAGEQLPEAAPAQGAPPTLAEVSPKAARPTKTHKQAPPAGRKPTKARGSRRAVPPRGQSVSKAAGPRRARRTSTHGARSGSRRRASSSLRARRLVPSAVVVGWSAFIAADIAVLLFALTGS